MLPYFQEQYGNAGTVYALGREAWHSVQTARGQVARLFSCAPGNVIFTSGGSEGNNMVFQGLRRHLLASGKTHLVVSATEHDSVIKAAKSLADYLFCITWVYPNSDGVITAEAVRSAIRQDTGLVSVMYANNETGSVNDISGIGACCKEHGILFHCDCVQAAGQYFLDVDKNWISFATVSSHKINGPKGVGALYARDFLFDPIICGGSDQEFGMRGGTENVPGIVGFGKACEMASDGMKENLIHVSAMKQTFLQELAKNLPYPSLKEAGIFINGETQLDPGKVLNLRISGVSGETLVLMMDALGVCISSGSACSSHESEPSHVLLAFGLSEDEARNSVRISFGKYNTEEEVRQAASMMAGCIETLRNSATIGGDMDGGDQDSGGREDMGPVL